MGESLPDFVPPSPAVAPRRVDRVKGWVHLHRPEILLVSLAIAIPELLTGSTPVVNLINPIAVAGLLGFYGAGVLVIRDVSLKWGNGWAAVLPLGLAYGIAEEGVATKTMVDPRSVAGFLGTYGHALGVNWVFAVVIDVFHAVFSIALPILLVQLAFPESRGVRFLTRRGLNATFGLLALSVTVGYFGFDPHYFEGYAVLALFAALTGAFIVIARFLPSRLFRPSSEAPRRGPAAFGWLGVAFAAVWSFAYLVLPHVVPWPVVPVAVEISGAMLVAVAVVSWSGRRGNEANLVYLAAGLLSWYVPFDVILTFLGDPPILLVLGAVYALVYLLAKRWRSTPTPLPTVPGGAALG